MTENKNHSLVVRPSSAVEKAAPGAKRILSGMVADTLAVANAQLECWYRTGEKYYHGQGVPQSYAEAVSWYRIAAEQNHADSQYDLGFCYENGRGVEKDYAEAVKWYRKAAEQNNAVAQNNLGVCYAKGRGVKQDSTEAVKWYRKAAEQNYALAQHNLGFCYEHGRGVPQDFAEAGKWYRKAADQGQIRAQENLGACYANGRVAIAIEDAVDAYKYVKLAEKKGYEGAAKTMEVISLMLSPEELREAERRYQAMCLQRNVP